MAARPLVGVQGADGETTGQTKLPAVFSAPIRPDVVQQVGTNVTVE
jgi:large subunit ribosomal protein L4e